MRTREPPPTLSDIVITIPAGESVSEPAPVTGGDLVRITMPDDWTGANLTFLVSTDGNSYSDLFDTYGNQVMMPVLPGTAVALYEATFWSRALAYLKLRSGSRNHPVAQAADRSITLTIAK